MLQQRTLSTGSSSIGSMLRLRAQLLAGGMGILSFITAGVAIAQQASVEINKISDSGVGTRIGRVTITESKKGTSFKVVVTGILPGMHGFHVHEKGDCGPAMKDGKMQAGLAAGGHYDPDGMKTHTGPLGAGHRGDLPVLKADAKGVNQVAIAPRLKLAEIRGRALVIHEAGDNYSDRPEDGGGKGRIACGVIPKG